MARARKTVLYSAAVALAIGVTAEAPNNQASAATIVGAVSATASSEYSSDYDIGNTIDQSGLSSNYISGVTNFDTYIGSNPTHTLTAAGFEWFSAEGVTSATVTYNLGSILNIDRLALWNEEFSGFGTGNLYGSTDNVIFSLLATINPIDSPSNQSYGVQVFGFATTALQYLQMEIRGCPQPDGDPLQTCGIGEVAFSSVGNDVVPIPAALPLFASGLGALGLLGWRRKRKNAAAIAAA